MVWLVPLLPLLAAPVFFLLGRAWNRAVWAICAVGIALASLALACFAVSAGWDGRYAWSTAIVLQLGTTPLSAIFAITVPAIAAAVIGFAAWHEALRGLPRLLCLLLVFTGAMELLVFAEDFLTLLIAWEVVGACSWALINHEWQEEDNARDAGWAFLVTRLGDLGLFLAVFVVFSNTGSFSYASLSSLNDAALPLFTASLLLAATAKSAQLPFSPWLFSAMAGPAPVSALLHAATMMAAGVYILIRLHGDVASVPWFEPVMIGIGLGTALVAGLVASSQFHAKKLLAASTSTHYGLMFIAVGAGYPGIATLHFVAHAVMKAALFLIAGVTGSAAGSYDLRTMRLGRSLPKIGFASLVASLALAGMFPLGAGWTKEQIITTVGHISPWLAFLTIIAGALSAVYAARFHYHAFARSPGHSDGHRFHTSRGETAGILVLASITLLLSLIWLPFTNKALEELLNLHFPKFKAWELASSLGLVVVGGAMGFWLVRKPVALESGAARLSANWFAIPALGKHLLLHPTTAGARILTRVDNQIDRVLTLTASGIQRLAKTGTRLSERVFNQVSGEVGRDVQWLAKIGTRPSERLFDQITGELATGVQYVAKLGTPVSERVVDQLPGGLANSAGRAGTLARQLQTGMSHHYYTLAAFGMALVIVILVLGDAL